VHQVQRRVDGEGVVREGVLAPSGWRARLSSLARLAWPQWSDTPRLTAALWAGLALISLAATMRTILADPTIQSDLSEVQYWLWLWTRRGVSPYGVVHLALPVDYPPFGLYALRWLNIVSRQQMLSVYPWVNLVICVLACWQLVRWFSELTETRLTTPERIGSVAMLLASRAIRRSLLWGQTAPFAILLFVLAMRHARRRPVLAGFCLALASYKLNLAAGFALALLLLGDWPVVAIAAVVAGAGNIAFAMSVGQPVSLVASQYVAGFFSIYGGEAFLAGVTGVRSLLVFLFGDYSIVRVLYPLVVALMLVAVGVLARGLGRDRFGRRLLVMGCVLWSLAGLTHQRYNTLLIFPVLWVLRTEVRPLIRVRWIRWTVPTIALFYLVGALPNFTEVAIDRALSTHPAQLASLHSVMEWFWQQGSRVIVLSAFGVVLLALWRMNAGLARPGRGDAASP
jgi:hypothetical protein